MQRMKSRNRQSDCPINYALEIIGNRWAFLVLRDIIYYGKHTYNEFLASAEHVTTRMLADRLDDLEREEMIQKTRSETDRRKEIYSLTGKGLDMLPLLVELNTWGLKYDTDTTIDQTLEKYLRNDRARVLN